MGVETHTHTRPDLRGVFLNGKRKVTRKIVPINLGHFYLPKSVIFDTPDKQTEGR